MHLRSYENMVPYVSLLTLLAFCSVGQDNQRWLSSWWFYTQKRFSEFIEVIMQKTLGSQEKLVRHPKFVQLLLRWYTVHYSQARAVSPWVEKTCVAVWRRIPRIIIKKQMPEDVPMRLFCCTEGRTRLSATALCGLSDMRREGWGPVRHLPVCRNDYALCLSYWETLKSKRE